MTIAQLEVVMAENAIRRLVSGYCDGVGRRDADAACMGFAPDVRVRIAHLPVRIGHTAAVEGLRSTISGYTFLHQKCDTGLIDVMGDRARARLGVLEMNQAIGGDSLFMMTGIYEDEYILLAEGWRIHRRHFTPQAGMSLPASAIQLFPDFVPAFAIACVASAQRDPLN